MLKRFLGGFGLALALCAGAANAAVESVRIAMIEGLSGSFGNAGARPDDSAA